MGVWLLPAGLLLMGGIEGRGLTRPRGWVCDFEGSVQAVQSFGQTQNAVPKSVLFLCVSASDTDTQPWRSVWGPIGPPGWSLTPHPEPVIPGHLIQDPVLVSFRAMD